MVRDTRDFPLALTEKQLLRLKDKAQAIEVPLLLEEGAYEARVSLQNKVSGEEKLKTFPVLIPK